MSEGSWKTVYKHSGPLFKHQREVGNNVQILRTSFQKSEGRWETVYIHSGPLSKGQSGGGNQVIRHSGPLSKYQRRGGRQCKDTQDLYLKVRGEVGHSVQTLRTCI